MRFLWSKLKKGLLIQTVKNGEKSKVKLLLEKHAEVNEKDSEETTPLMAAVSGAHLDIVKVLAEAGADVNEKNNQGFTALSMAISAGHLDMVNVLLENGAEVRQRVGPMGPRP